VPAGGGGVTIGEAIKVNCALGGWFYLGADATLTNYNRYKIDGDGLVVTSRNFQQATWHSIELAPDALTGEWCVELDDGTTLFNLADAYKAGWR
jgi:hypothetical protein